MLKDILLIDIGNTAIKWSYLGESHSVLLSEFHLDLLPDAQHIYASCVGDYSLLDDIDGVVFAKSQASFNAFKSAYEDVAELGVDRFLAMIAAIELYPNQTRLIIDAGSALTFDLVLADGSHQGGLIMPGLGKLRRSFDQFCTESQQLHSKKLGSNTSEAWACGTGEMFTAVIDAQITRYLEEFGDLVVVLTGGDSKISAIRIQHANELHKNLVLEGLSIYAQTLTA